MEEFYAYIKNIGCYAVFSSVIKMLVPEGSFKSLINMFLGLVFLAVMLNPLSRFLNTGLPELKDYVLKEEAKLGSEILDENSENRELVLAEYKELVCERVSALCGGFVDGVKVNVEIGDDFSVEGVFIEGRLIGDRQKLISLIGGALGCTEDKIFLRVKEE